MVAVGCGLVLATMFTTLNCRHSVSRASGRRIDICVPPNGRERIAPDADAADAIAFAVRFKSEPRIKVDGNVIPDRLIYSNEISAICRCVRG